MHEVLVNHLGGLSLPRKSVVRLTDRPDMTLDVYRGRKYIYRLSKVQKGISKTSINEDTMPKTVTSDTRKDKKL